MKTNILLVFLLVAIFIIFISNIIKFQALPSCDGLSFTQCQFNSNCEWVGDMRLGHCQEKTQTSYQPTSGCYNITFQYTNYLIFNCNYPTCYVYKVGNMYAQPINPPALVTVCQQGTCKYNNGVYTEQFLAIGCYQSSTTTTTTFQLSTTTSTTPTLTTTTLYTNIPGDCTNPVLLKTCQYGQSVSCPPTGFSFCYALYYYYGAFRSATKLYPGQSISATSSFAACYELYGCFIPTTTTTTTTTVRTTTTTFYQNTPVPTTITTTTMYQPTYYQPTYSYTPTTTSYQQTPITTTTISQQKPTSLIDKIKNFIRGILEYLLKLLG
jgi:hypothetical protein